MRPFALVCLVATELKKLTRIVVTEIFSLATVLLALGPQVRLDRTFFTRLQDDTENLFACPQSHGLMDTQHSKAKC